MIDQEAWGTAVVNRTVLALPYVAVTPPAVCMATTAARPSRAKTNPS
jgi:hypothetical protein